MRASPLELPPTMSLPAISRATRDAILDEVNSLGERDFPHREIDYKKRGELLAEANRRRDLSYYNAHGVRFGSGEYDRFIGKIKEQKMPSMETFALLFYMTGSLMFFAGSLCLWFK